MNASAQLLRYLPAALASLGAIAQHEALATYEGLPALLPATPARRPPVSIIIPARDEATNLAVLLPTIDGLTHQPRELIVVDDDSRDETAAVAIAAGARVVSTGGPPPPDWIGKSWACHLGAESATGEWLLFLDADTRLAPSTLDAAVATALEHGFDALSVLADQQCTGFWQKLLLPFAYAGYFAGVDRKQINQRPEHALVNGQFVLVKREAYEAIGGHQAVAQSIVEDVALGVALLRAGLRVGLCRSGGLVQVRMYGTAAELFRGFEKNSFSFVRLQPRRGLRIAASTAFAAGAAGSAAISLLAQIKAWAEPRQRRGGTTQMGNSLIGAIPGLVAISLAMTAQARWSGAFGVSRAYGLLQPLAGAAFLLIALRSAAGSVGNRGVNWKGRMYRP